LFFYNLFIINIFKIKKKQHDRNKGPNGRAGEHTDFEELARKIGINVEALYRIEQSWKICLIENNLLIPRNL
jgi:hypothetical protein